MHTGVQQFIDAYRLGFMLQRLESGPAEQVDDPPGNAVSQPQEVVDDALLLVEGGRLYRGPAADRKPLVRA
jgi:hypothetical protein